jgi:RimJ/RimL family protein N-acetyltransferase
MRTAVLSLAFDHLGAHAAVSSARVDNVASLGVSRSIGYLDNGISEVRQPSSPTGRCTLQHVRLTRESWLASSLGARVAVSGVADGAAWFG